VNLADPGTLNRLLAKHGMSARKGLGQHFLVSKTVVDAIRDRFVGFGGVLEIGPGPGVLTGPISEMVEKFIALEIDERIPALLAESAPEAEVRLRNALEAPLADVLSELPEPRGIVSNLPYYITGPLLGRIIEARSLWSRAVLMMQREVGVRILAPVGDRDRGALSVMVQARFEVAKVANVPPGAFLPPPKVDSVVLELTPKPEEFPDKLFDFVHAGFSQPRKTLSNNLAAAGYRKDVVVEAGLESTIRPHQVELSAWSRLFELSG